MPFLKFFVLLSSLLLMAVSSPKERNLRVVLAVHGGTGMDPKLLTPEMGKSYREGLEEALKVGYAALKSGSSLDAVEAAVKTLEDNPLFNAGKGSVFTHDGKNELDAAVMDGKTLRAGAVAGVTRVKNPISAARVILEKSPHVMLVGAGADAFAKKEGLEIVDPSYFWTERRWNELQEEFRKEVLQKKNMAPPAEEKKKKGTVGAVAVDKNGNLAAATSTGGMTNKDSGRVGDTPIIGAGTYADNESCAVSATGHGEFFIRYVVAHDIAALVKYRKLSVTEAAQEVIERKLTPVGGEGGVIVLDAKGHYTGTFNSEGLYRGWATEDGKFHVALYRE
jgi:L-asparaginase / beta-aspartyl-peptidase